MFYYLEGQVSLTGLNLAVIDIGGIGYECHTTMNTLSHIEQGKKTRLYTYCNIKEDAFDIYGFYDLSEKRCFEMLLSVSGVGPKAALSILSSSTPEGLAVSILTGDEKALTMAPGIGKRIAQRVILELKDKVSKESESLHVEGFAASSTGIGVTGTKMGDAAAALVVLGYSQSEISAAMRTVDAETMTVEEIIRYVLTATMK